MKSELKSRTAAALVSLMMGGWASLASAGGEPDGGVSLKCDPCTEPNGRGIYVADPHHYCIEDKVDGKPMRFCPEAFIEVPAQGGAPARVELAGTYFEGSTLKETKLTAFPTVSVRLPGGSLAPLLGVETGTTEFVDTNNSIGTSNSKLMLVYKKDKLSPEIKVSSEDLNGLTLHIPSPLQPRARSAHVPPLLAYLLNFKQVAVADAVTPMYQYEVSWRSMSPYAQAHNLCSGGQRMSVLPGKRVNGTGGRVTDEVRTTTMACATGAIVQCMIWGYRPDNLKYTPKDQDLLMSACIQAKRAAYFGGPRSYTENGHTIAMTDSMLIPNYRQVKKGTVSRVEAIWTAEKAYCVNEDNRRVKPHPKFPPNWQQQVPECNFDKLPLDWAKYGFIATGSAEATTSVPGQ